MPKEVTLFVVPDMEESEVAIQLLRSLPDTVLHIEPCGSSMRELYVCPFIRDEENRPHYGLDSVERYAKLALLNRNGKAH